MEECSVLTYNVMLMVEEPWRYQGAKERSRRLAESVYRTCKKIPDVICLQELVAQYQNVVASFTEHPHVTGPVRASWCSDKIRFWPSGLCTLSKYPITHEHHYIFVGDTYHMEVFVAKGALHTRILHPTVGGINIVNVHLNAWTTPRARNARLDQINQLKNWLGQLSLPSHEPLIVCGDFNMDFYETLHQVETMATILNCKYVLPEQVQFSFDAANNELVGCDDPSEYKTLHHHHQSLPPRQLVDGFLVPRHCSALAYVEVLYARSSEPFPLHLNITTRQLANDLSDHFPVLLKLTLPEKISQEVLQTRVVVRDGSFSWKIFLYQSLAVIVLLSVILYFRHKR